MFHETLPSTWHGIKAFYFWSIVWLYSERNSVGSYYSCIIFSLYLFQWWIKWGSKTVTPWTIYSPGNSPGQNTGVGSLALLQGIFPTQGWNPGLPHCRWILYQLSHKGSPRILEWVAYPFSRESSQPRHRTQVSHTAGRFFTNWAIREAQRLK